MILRVVSALAVVTLDPDVLISYYCCVFYERVAGISHLFTFLSSVNDVIDVA